MRRNPSGVTWLRAELFTPELAEDLNKDIEVLRSLLERFGSWQQETDSKLDALEELLTSQHAEDKVLIFSEYRDTTEYIAKALAHRGVERVASVSGSDDNPTFAARRFSPKSNATLRGLPSGHEELRVLVATDVLSEGQNLQDAHVLVNFDLPWAITKLIQRAGRVDRLGQQSAEVFVYSFLPNDEVEDVITLRDRLRRRLSENAAAFGTDEEFFGDAGEWRLIKGLFDETSETWEDDQPYDVDWTSLAYEIWRKAQQQHLELAQKAEALPDVVFATKHLAKDVLQTGSQDRDPGVLIYVQTVLGLDAFAYSPHNGEPRLLSPYEALQLAECEPTDNPLPRRADHHNLVSVAIKGPLRSPARNMEGALTGVRKRCWERLRNYQEKYPSNLFTDSLEQALDQLHRRPLLERATQRLSRALRERSLDDLAHLVVDLHQEGLLCVKVAEENSDQPQIVCSLGIISSTLEGSPEGELS